MKKKNRLQMLAALLAATLSVALTSPIAAKANEEYNVGITKEANADTGRIYYLKNSHGDVIGQLDENGNLLTSYAYNAFGEQISAVVAQGEQKSTTNRFLYAGEQYDETSGLYYLRARHYDVRAGRFTQEDTYLGDGRNLYAYVHSNPLKYVDPTGHYSVEIFEPDGNSLEEKIKFEGGGGVGNPVNIAGYGSTGRTVPNTLTEQMAMHQVQSNPLNGATDMSQVSNPVIMVDPRWPASDGWVKMSNNVSGVEIHFVHNKVTGAYDDFKFK